MERQGKNGGKLKSFEPGQSGNQKGRPKGVPNAKTRMARFLELSINGKNPITKEDEPFTVAELMDLQVISKAIKGDLQAWEKINDRLEGKAPSSLDLTTDGESLNNPLNGLNINDKADLIRKMNEAKNAGSDND